METETQPSLKEKQKSMKDNRLPGGSAGPESTCNARDPSSSPGLGRFPRRRDRLPTPIFLGFPGGSDSKESTGNMRDVASIHRLGRSRGGGHGNPPQHSCLENPHGQRSLAGYSPWDRKESDTTQRLTHMKEKVSVMLAWYGEGGYRKEVGQQVRLERGAGLGYKKPVNHNLYFVL